MTELREVVPATLAGERLDRLVAMITGRSRAEAASLVSTGAVRLDGRPVTTRATKIAAGNEIVVSLADDSDPTGPYPEPEVAVVVVHEDDDLLVVDKPAGLVVHPGAGQARGTLVNGLLARYPELAEVGPDRQRPGIVHRLDAGTSGLLLVARTQAAHERMVADLAARRVHRRYRTLVWGHPEARRGLIDAPVGRSSREPTRMTISERGKPARTRYEVLARWHEPAEVAELRCELETGRTHQIRVHLRSIGHPVVGDDRYGGSRQRLPLERPFLHAERLDLQHPISGERLSLESALPADLSALLALLR